MSCQTLCFKSNFDLNMSVGLFFRNIINCKNSRVWANFILWLLILPICTECDWTILYLYLYIYICDLTLKISVNNILHHLDICYPLVSRIISKRHKLLGSKPISTFFRNSRESMWSFCRANQFGFSFLRLGWKPYIEDA